MVRLKKILPEHDIVVYGYNKDEIDILARRFVTSGYNKVSVYYHFIDEWTTDPSLPMKKLEKFSNLVSAEWVDTTVIMYGKFMYPDNDYPFPGSAAGDIGAIICATCLPISRVPFSGIAYFMHTKEIF